MNKRLIVTFLFLLSVSPLWGQAAAVLPLNSGSSGFRGCLVAGWAGNRNLCPQQTGQHTFVSGSNDKGSLFLQGKFGNDLINVVFVKSRMIPFPLRQGH